MKENSNLLSARSENSTPAKNQKLLSIRYIMGECLKCQTHDANSNLNCQNMLLTKA